VGRNLFIRVSAETYDEKEVFRAWPTVYAMIWPDAEEKNKGVLQLVDAFVEYIHFGNMADAARNALAELARMLERLRAELDEALSNRDVQMASGLTTAIEDALDKAENVARRMNA
jgi:hypothetical protein